MALPLILTNHASLVTLPSRPFVSNDPNRPLIELPVELTVLEPGQALAIDKIAIDLNGGPLCTGDTIEYRVVVKNVVTIVQTGVVITDAMKLPGEIAARLRPFARFTRAHRAASSQNH